MEIELREEYPRPGTDLSMSERMITMILDTVERIHPSLIVDPAQLVNIGPFSFAEVRVALALRAIAMRERQREKILPDGLRVQLFTRYDRGRVDRKGEDLPRRIQIRVADGGTYILDIEFPILEPEGLNDLYAVSVHDWRHNHHVTLAAIQERGYSLEDLQLIWSGLRCLCRNLRTWDQTGFFYPEEVN